MNVNLALAATMQDRLTELGGISPDRVRLQPTPGLATIADLESLNESKQSGLYELVDGTLVEKAMGFEAAVVAVAFIRILSEFVSKHRLGLVSGPDGLFQLLDSVRGPDVAYISRERLPGGNLPSQAYPQLSPNLVVEVLSPGNTKAEMARKRMEYFHSGVQIVWMVDCLNRTIAIYTSGTAVRVVNERETLDAGDVLPGFSCPVADFFADLDIGQDIGRDNSEGG